MDNTNQDIEEIDILKSILQKMDEIELEGKNSIYTHIYENQPFILAMMMGYESHVDSGTIKEEEFNVIRDLLFMVYLFFDQRTNIKQAQVQEEAFAKQLEININFMEYLAGEDLESQLELNEANLSKMRFGNLYTSITYMANDYKDFKKLDEGTKAGVFVELKSLIECLEASLL